MLRNQMPVQGFPSGYLDDDRLIPSRPVFHRCHRPCCRLHYETSQDHFRGDRERVNCHLRISHRVGSAHIQNRPVHDPGCHGNCHLSLAARLQIPRLPRHIHLSRGPIFPRFDFSGRKHRRRSHPYLYARFSPWGQGTDRGYCRRRHRGISARHTHQDD